MIKLIDGSIHTEDFEKNLNKAISEGFKPIYETFRVSGDLGDCFCILVENKKMQKNK